MSFFWKPGARAPEPPPVSVDRDDGSNGDVDFDSFAVLSNARASLPLWRQRERLPIFRYRKEILYLLEKHSTTVIVGETGSGKSTQIPQYLCEAGWAAGGRQIVCTQPRRVAVTSLAARVAEEMGVSLGAEVGYAIRFENAVTENVTRIKYVTDGLLIQEMMENPLLSSYSVIMVDEAHERSLATDTLLGLLKKVQRRRPDLRLIIASATMEAEEIAGYFDDDPPLARAIKDLPTGGRDTEGIVKDGNGAASQSLKSAILSVEGRTHGVQVLYLEQPTTDYVRCAVTTTMELHKQQTPGDILVFLTGQDEIETAVQLVRDEAHGLPRNSKALVPLALYAGLSMEEQERVFTPLRNGQRKVIFATNIAETSVTIEGIVYVVDPGFSKQKFYDPVAGLEMLTVVPISKASAVQRAGRAGRLRPGKCLRLYTEEFFTKEMSPRGIPEMQRSDLASTVLQLKALGIDNIMRFDFLAPPPPEIMIRALEKLYAIGVLGRDARLTPVGSRIAEVPLDPTVARMLVTSGELECSQEMLTIAASLSVHSVWYTPRGAVKLLDEAKSRFAVAEGDLITYINVYEGFIRSQKSATWCHENCINYKAMTRIADVRRQLSRHLKRLLGVPIRSCGRDNIEKVRKTIAASLFMNAAQLQPHGDGGTYKTMHGNNLLHIHPSSVLSRSRPKWVVYHSVRVTERAYMCDVTSIDMKWLIELAPHFYRTREFKQL